MLCDVSAGSCPQNRPVDDTMPGKQVTVFPLTRMASQLLLFLGCLV